MGNCDDEIDCKVDCVIDQILREDRLESMGLDPCPDSCNASCREETVDQPNKNCAVETSARFSIRILEALRGVQRQKPAQTWPSSTMEEVVQYIQRHYHYDGDLCSQVETALNQVTRQGFVQKMGVNRYHLMGPFACSVQKPPYIFNNCDKNRPKCGTSRPSRGRRRKSCTPMANTNLTASDCPEPLSMDRLSELSNVENSQSAVFENRNSRERSCLRGGSVSHPFNEDQDISVLEDIHAPAPDESLGRPGAGGGGGYEPAVQNHNVNENMEQIRPPAPNEPVRRPGGGAGRGRVIRDHSFDENIEEMHAIERPDAQEQAIGDQSSDENVGEVHFPFPDGVVRRSGSCGGRGNAFRDHSSDENMFRELPAMNSTREILRRRQPCRRRRRDSCSSRNSSDTVTSRCATRGSSKNTINCSSDADQSDDTDVDEADNAKPWIRHCQNQEGQIFTRRSRRCSS